MKRSAWMRGVLCLVCLLACMPAWSQEDGKPGLVALLERAEAIKPLVGDERDALTLRGGAVVMVGQMAWWSGDEQAMQQADQALERLTRTAIDEDEEYTRDFVMSARCELLAAMGRFGEAEKLAWMIPDQAVRARSEAMIAWQVARRGDPAGYRAQMAKALRMMDEVIRADAARDPEDSAFPAYTLISMVRYSVNDLILAGVWSAEQSLEELNWLAEQYGKLPLGDGGARAELLGILAYAYASLGQKDAALTRLKLAEVAIAAEQKAVDALDPDDQWMAHGVDGAYYEAAIAYAKLGEEALANAAIEKMGNGFSKQLARMYVLPYKAEHGGRAEAWAALRPLVDQTLEAHRVVKARGKQDGLGEIDEDDPWIDYDAHAVFWQVYGIAEVETNLGDRREITRLRAKLPDKMSQLALDMGSAWAKIRPMVKPVQP